MPKIPMTAKGLANIQDELKRLKGVDRPKVIAAIAEAHEHGDRSENAEYHAARERQTFLETRVKELEDILSAAEVIDLSKLSGDQVQFGARVTMLDQDTDDESTLRLLSRYEANMKEGSTSIDSPLAKALLGKKAGDTVEVAYGSGIRSYQIIAVSYT